MDAKQLWMARRASQVLFFILLAVILTGTFCSLSLGQDFFLTCPLGALQFTIGAREIAGAVVISALLLLALTLALGRVFCGWICPFGALLDWLGKPLAKFRLSRQKVAAALQPDNKAIKYGVLGGVLIAAGVLRQPAFCTLCPVGTTCRTANLQGLNIGLETAVLPLILSTETVNRRFWCKVLCPIGALLALVARFRFAGVRLPAAECAGCNRCEQACAMDNEPRAGHSILKTNPIVLQALVEYGVPDLLDRPGRADAIPAPIRDLLADRAKRIKVGGAECSACYSCAASCPVLGRSGAPPAAAGRPAGVSA